MEYATDLFDLGTIERLRGNFKTLLEAVAVEADRPISELPLLSEAERHRLLGDGTRPRPTIRKEKLVHRLFEEQGRADTPRRRWSMRDDRMTYAELNTPAPTGWSPARNWSGTGGSGGAFARTLDRTGGWRNWLVQCAGARTSRSIQLIPASPGLYGRRRAAPVVIASKNAVLPERTAHANGHR